MLRVSLLSFSLLAVTVTAADFTTDIHPILARRCLGCHSGARPQGGLSLESRDKAAAVLERSGVRLMSRLNGTTMPQMPLAGAPLTAAEVAKIREWLDEGAIWPDAPTQQTKSDWVAPLEPRNPPVPAGTAANPVDRFIDAYLATNKFDRPEAVSDAMFARRAYFDVTGLPPSVTELARFEADKNPTKRVHLIDTLISDNK
ncbi:MAG TPA: DUF1549 domain-containing protein, partial [Bryobacteraceae bacterium]